MTPFLLQVATTADSTSGLDTLPGRRLAFLPAQHTDFVWAVDGPAGWAIVGGVLALPLLAGFALGWWARGRRRAG